MTDTDLSISTPPDITVNATGPSGAPVTYTLPSVSDPDDAVAPTPTCSASPGSAFAIGTTTVKCIASDPDDTPSTVSTSFTVTVEGASAQLADLHQAVEGVGPGKSLSDKVAQAQAYPGAGDVAGTCATLGAFVHEVQAQSAKHISSTTASRLVADAQRIRAVLSC